MQNCAKPHLARVGALQSDVLDDLKTCIDVLDDMDGVLDDVWTSVHCLKQDLGDQAGFNNLDF